MVASISYFATEADQVALLDYLGATAPVTLHPWPVVKEPAEVLSRPEAMGRRHVMIASTEFGDPVLIRPGSDAMKAGGRSGFFNQLNWDRLSPQSDEGLVDSNASPVLFWKPGSVTKQEIWQSEIGSQADSMTAISADYARWVNRTMNWVRRKGTKVWGREQSAFRPDLNIQLTVVNAVVALPEALAALEAGARGRGT